MNKVVLMGRLTKDPDVREKATRISIAVDRNSNNAEQSADFINCVAFDKTGENIGKFFTKGRRILVEGHIHTGSYIKDTGNTVYTTDVVVDRFFFVDSQPKSDGFTSSIDDDDMPFN